jgi:peptide chain release factor 2
MLARMYARWFTKNGVTIDCLDWNEPEAGLVKEASLLVDTDFRSLKTETGIHRLTRISPFCAANKPQTSFALVTIEPEPGKRAPFVIPESEVRIDVYRAQGPGGQGVNTTDSAVRAIHTPTGISATCQSTRSQHANKEFALRILAQRVAAASETPAQIKRAGTGWGEAIRSYVLNGSPRVKDHRDGSSDARPKNVLDGNLHSFLPAPAPLRN